jgi:SAM-dependent MidA family methyltransferase
MVEITAGREGRRPIVEHIRKIIQQAGGRIPFADYMREALYHPLYGYYNQEALLIGEGGDFYTSPMVHPIFGQCVARQIVEIWEQMGSPAEYAIIEMGAGLGMLARDMMEEWRRMGTFVRSWRYIIVEQSPALQKRQKVQLKHADIPVDWYRTLKEIPDYGRLVGVVVTNELFDALPVHRLMMENGVLVERYVTEDRDAFREVSGPLSDPRLERIVGDGVRERLQEGDRLEVCLQAADVLHEMAGLLSAGCILTFDYGDLQPDIYLKHVRRGGIRCYHRQKLHDDPYERIGEQDMTADVDFSLLIRTGEEAGLYTAGLTTQARFLAGLGFVEKAEELERRAFTDWEADREWQRIMALFLPHGLGEAVKVLIQYKNMEKPVLKGLNAGAQMKRRRNGA